MTFSFPAHRCVLQTYTEEDRLIITQMPFPTTVVDFWALVWDYTCTAVVVLNQLQELDEVSSIWASLPSPTSLGTSHMLSAFAPLPAAGAHCQLVGSIQETPEDTSAVGCTQSHSKGASLGISLPLPSVTLLAAAPWVGPQQMAGRAHMCTLWLTDKGLLCANPCEG